MRVLRRLVFVLLIGLIPVTVFAGDALHRLTHNDQDGLYLAILEEIEDGELSFRVEESIVSVENMSQDKWEPLEIDHFRLKSSTIPEINIAGQRSENDFFELEEPYLVSLNKEGEDFLVEWGIFKLEKDGEGRFRLASYEEMLEHEKSVAKTIEVFVNSKGQKIEFFPASAEKKEEDVATQEEAEDMIPKEEARLPFFQGGMGYLVLAGLFVLLILTKINRDRNY
ncbi:MAG: hypothetical protein Q3993_03075 [Filifactor alocis]|nr:hypothetical protein [Filifactor alocis]